MIKVSSTLVMSYPPLDSKHSKHQFLIQKIITLFSFPPPPLTCNEIELLLNACSRERGVISCIIEFVLNIYTKRLPKSPNDQKCIVQLYTFMY